MILIKKSMISISGIKSRLDHYWWIYERFKVLPLLMEVYLESHLSHYKGLGAAGAGI